MIEKSYQKIVAWANAVLPQPVTDLMFRFRRVLKYLVAGSTAAFVDLVILYILTERFHYWYLNSAIIAYLVAFLVSFSLQKFWTFRDDSKDKMLEQAGMFLTVSLFGNLVINTALLYVFVDIFHIWYLFSQVVISLLVAFVNFFIYRNIVFKSKS